ncbi:MAG: branched-chain amino acid ABC transporter ATP-binding protein/permease [Desulfocapsaceae bacterium]|nr:branched-chain amino acid ABC transporter ATP-binding protein/permease [Desulfocapsaceae bacterium]
MKRFNPSIVSRPNSVFILIFALSLTIIPSILPNDYWQSVYAITGIYVMLALGLNIVAGFTGLLDLSYIAFFGIGGYSFAFLCSDHFGIHFPFLLAVPLCALITMFAGFLLGLTSIRLRGDYLAIVTLAFAQIFKLLLLNLDAPVNITGGVNGIYVFDAVKIFSLNIITPQHYSALIWSCALLVFIVSFKLKDSRIGRGWNAIREDELAANCTGINSSRLKLYSFATGAMIAGFAGAVFASFQDSVFPNNFDFQQLVVVYCMVIIGGLGNMYGVIAGAVVLSILPEVLREYGGLRMMIYGATLVAIMALRPQGLFSAVPVLTRVIRRPDKDETGRLRASTDLYYSSNETPAVTAGHFRQDEEILVLDRLGMQFGGITALDNLDLSLHKHEILSVIGPNGAGKSTLFNVISGIYQPSSGTISYRGKDISSYKPYQVTRAGIARTFQNIRLFNEMSVIENIRASRFCRTSASFFSIIFNLGTHRREEAHTDVRAKEILAMFGKRLTGYRFRQNVSQLSYANRRRVEIARAMGSDPEILLLDEPSAGMNPHETAEITEFIKRLRDQYGYTIIVIEHKLSLVKAVSDRVIVMDHGIKIAEGSYDEVAADPDVIEAYLGKKGQRGKPSDS